MTGREVLHAASCPVQYSQGNACGCDYSRAVPAGPSLYRDMLAARAHAVAMGNDIARRGCADGTCDSEVNGYGCDAVALWLDWTNEYDRLRAAWIDAGRPE